MLKDGGILADSEAPDELKVVVPYGGDERRARSCSSSSWEVLRGFVSSIEV